MLNPVEKEIFEKLEQAHRLISEASSTYIEGDFLYERGKEINCAMKNPTEYMSLLNEINEKIEKVMQYVLDKDNKNN